MIKKHFFKAFLVTAIALFCFTASASAVIQEVNGMGTITSLDKDAGTINISSEYQFTISYTGSTPNEEWIKATETEVTGNAPDVKAFELFKVGDPVRFIILGGTGGDYLGIAKINKISGDAEISAIVGDIDRMIFKPLAGGFAVTAVPDPNCAECSGTTCTAASAAIKVTKNGNTLTDKSFLPGEEFIVVTNNPEDYDFYIQFVEGEGLSSTCNPNEQMMGGPQAVSTYVLEITPGIALVQETTATEATPTPQSGIAGIICLIGVLAAMAVISRK